jgi:hypothetical protein
LRSVIFEQVEIRPVIMGVAAHQICPGLRGYLLEIQRNLSGDRKGSVTRRRKQECAGAYAEFEPRDSQQQREQEYRVYCCEHEDAGGKRNPRFHSVPGFSIM